MTAAKSAAKQSRRPRSPEKALPEIEKLNDILGKPGKFERISKSVLQTDDTYQRDQCVTKSCAIAENFDWNAFGAIIVARRKDGVCKVVDGGHRVNAALLRPEITTLPCLVFDSEGAAQEARAFLEINTRRLNVNQVCKFRAGLKAGNPTIVAVDKIVRKSGFSITDDRKAKSGLGCPFALQEIFEKEGVSRLETVLGFCANSWLKEGHDITCPIIKGTNLFASLLETKLGIKLNDNEVLARFATTDLVALKKRMHHFKGYDDIKSNDRAFARAMVEEWDKGRKGKRLSGISLQ